MRLFVQKNAEGVWDVTESVSRVGYRNCFITNVSYAVQPTDKVLEDTGFDKSVFTKLRMTDLGSRNPGEISWHFG